MLAISKTKIRLVSAVIGLSLLAGCVTPPPPPPPPPPPAPPPVKIIPPRPTTPGSAALGMYIPPRGSDGLRQTVNYGLTDPQKLWNVRSALNVSVLNCLDPQYAGLLPAYRTFLERHKRELKRTNDTVVAAYRAEYGRSYRSEFDGYMTQVYNYYALPPAQTDFCNTMLTIANESALVEKGGLDLFASVNMPRIELVFDRFYSSYEQYQIDVVAWDAEYGASTAPAAGFAPMQTVQPLGTETTVIPVGVPASEPTFVSEPVVQEPPQSEAGGGGN